MKRPATRLELVRARRRAMMGAGFVVLLLASATACIFDKSDYQGGGRIDKGATAKTAEPEPTTTATATSEPTATTDPTAILRDAGSGG